MVWVPQLLSEKAVPGAGLCLFPCPFSSPERAVALSLHLSSLALVPEVDTPAVGQELRAAEAALEILVVLISLAQVFQALYLLLERRNRLLPRTVLRHVFSFSCFLATAAALIKG